MQQLLQRIALKTNVEYGLDRLNTEVRDWLLGVGEAPDFIHTGKSPIWTRTYSDEVEEDDCRTLARCSRAWARIA
ncbi:MAG: hypothetical protein GY838_16315 [bacterium]|nr:hypothetical protein [bacterium]